MPETNQKTNKTKVVEYKPFRELTLEEIKKLPSVKVTLEKRTYQGRESAQLTVEFHEKWKKPITNRAMIDMRKYHLILSERSDFNDDDVVHVTKLPCRFLQRHDENGEVKYSRFEVMFTRDVVISDFLDYVDQKLVEKLEVDINWIEDRDSSKEFTIANAETNYAFFQ